MSVYRLWMCLCLSHFSTVRFVMSGQKRPSDPSSSATLGAPPEKKKGGEDGEGMSTGSGGSTAVETVIKLGGGANLVRCSFVWFEHSFVYIAFFYAFYVIVIYLIFRYVGCTPDVIVCLESVWMCDSVIGKWILNLFTSDSWFWSLVNWFSLTLFFYSCRKNKISKLCRSKTGSWERH